MINIVTINMLTALGTVFSKLLSYTCNRYDISKEKLKKILWIAPENLCFRIGLSLIPPVTAKFKRLHIDLLGPILAIILLILILNYGSVFANTSEFLLSPTEVILIYIIAVPILYYILNKIGHSWISLLEVFVLFGYALYGYVFTLLVSILFFSESSNVSFFISLIIFGGLSTFRMVLLQMQLIPLPGARLIICSIISVVHILFLVFIYFTYMHPSFVYGKNLQNGFNKISRN